MKMNGTERCSSSAKPDKVFNYHLLHFYLVERLQNRHRLITKNSIVETLKFNYILYFIIISPKRTYKRHIAKNQHNYGVEDDRTIFNVVTHVENMINAIKDKYIIQWTSHGNSRLQFLIKWSCIWIMLCGLHAVSIYWYSSICVPVNENFIEMNWKIPILLQSIHSRSFWIT